MKPYFRSPELQREFERNGFVRLPLLSKEECRALIAKYQKIENEHLKLGISFITTSHSNDYTLIKKADDMIKAALAGPIEKILHNYKLLFSNFLIKMSGPDSATPCHQDSTFVDELKFRSISIWLSLQDTDEQNGCMKFIKGSHKYLHTLRPTHYHPWAYTNVREELEQMAKSYPSNMGEAFIFDHAVIHGSHANKTTEPRIAIVLAAYPHEAQLFDFYLPKGESTRVEKYKMTPEAYLSIVKGEPPSMGEYVGDVSFDFLQLSKEQFAKIVARSHVTGEKTSMITRLKEGLLSALK